MTDAALRPPKAAAPPRSRADLFMCRLLCVPASPSAVDAAKAQRLFSGSILLSALRCLLTYIVLPVLTPLIGAATRVSAEVGLPLALVALYFDVRGIRRFWLAGHRQRWLISAIYVAVMGLVVALAVGDVVSLTR